jgi:hypothetical protein
MPDTGAPWNLPYPSPSAFVRDAPEQFEDLAEAVADGLNRGFKYVARRIFSTAGTFTFTKSDPLGDGSLDGNLIRAYRVVVVGGGGGGAGGLATGSGQVSAAGGGGAGGYAERFVLASEYGATVTVIVGAAGAGGTGAAGTAGGTTSWNGTDTRALGGSAGQPRPAGTPPQCSQTVPGGNGTHGDILIRGGAGTSQSIIGTVAGGGIGGASMLGSGGNGTGSTGATNDASGFGAGGGGRGQDQPSQAAVTGGVATAGVVIVELYA